MVSFCKAAVEYKSTHRDLVCGQCLCCLGKSTLRGIAAQLCDQTLSKHKEAFIISVGLLEEKKALEIKITHLPCSNI